MPAKEKIWIIEICAFDVYILARFNAIQRSYNSYISRFLELAPT